MQTKLQSFFKKDQSNFDAKYLETSTVFVITYLRHNVGLAMQNLKM